MPKRELKIDAVSWKTRKVLSHNMWIFVSKDIDLATFRVGETYPVDVSQLLDGRWVIDNVIKG